MSSITVSETTYIVATSTTDTAITVSESTTTVDVRGGIVGPAPTGIDTSSVLTKEGLDLLMWNVTRLQYEPARLSPLLSATFLQDMVYVDGSLDFSLADGSQMLPVIGV